MKYFYFLCATLLTLAILYSISGITYFKWIYYQAENPKAEFLVMESKGNTLTIVDFINYRCGYCKKMRPIIDEALKLHKDVRYIPRPISFKTSQDNDAKQKPNELVKLALAAGMQGKFKEMHDTFLEYPDGLIPEDVIKETALLYNINYEKMVEDSKSKKVEQYLNDNIDDMVNMNIKSIPSYIVGQNIYAVSNEMPNLKKFLTMITNEKKKNE